MLAYALVGLLSLGNSVPPPTSTAIVAAQPAFLSAASTNNYTTNIWGMVMATSAYSTASTVSQWTANQVAGYGTQIYYSGTNPVVAGVITYRAPETATATVVYSADGTVPFGITSPITFPTNVTGVAYYNFVGYTNPACLPALVTSNYFANRTNKTAQIWNNFTYGVPPPGLSWNTNCIMYGDVGETAFSLNEVDNQGNGWFPTTLLTRRVAYQRGHSNGISDGTGNINTNGLGGKVYFLDRLGNSYVGVVSNGIGHARGQTNNAASDDYTLICFTSDIPTNIDVMMECNFTNILTYYYATNTGAAYQFMGLFPEQYGYSYSYFNTYGNDWMYGNFLIGGDSGSPNLIPVPMNGGTTLVMCSGRTTTGYDPQMLQDLYNLEAASGLNTNLPAYQPVVMQFTNYPVINF